MTSKTPNPTPCCICHIDHTISAETVDVSAQLDVIHGAAINHLMLVRPCLYMYVYVIYGTWVVLSWHYLTEGVQVLRHQNNINTLSLEN